jgi:transcriptional regulator with XRE-family HTH domain
MNTVGERIKARRTELGWTQEELCKKASISTGFLSDVENSKRSVSAETLLGLARVLSLSLDYLMKGDSTQPTSAEVQFPASLAEFAKSENISFVQALTLLDMRLQIVAHRSSSKSDHLEDFDWKKFYDSVKEFL